MAKKSKFTLVEPDENLVLLSYNLGELSEKIEELAEKCPDKRTSEYTTWRGKINLIIEDYNKKCGFKAYRKYEAKV